MSKRIGHFTVLLVLIGLVSGLYLALSGSAFEARKAAVKRPDLPESVVSECARRMILNNYYSCEGFLDESTLKAKPEAVVELAGHLREILRLAPELEPMVEYFGTVKWEYECRVVFTTKDGQEDVPGEVEELLERFDGLVFGRNPVRDGELGNPGDTRLEFVLRDDDVSAIGLSDLMRISPRFNGNSVAGCPEMSFPDFRPGSEFRDAGIVLEGKRGAARISFMGYLKNDGVKTWTFECGANGGRLAK